MPDAWPLFDLRIRTARLELRLPTDSDLMALADIVRHGVHDPAVMPFLVPWTDLPSPELERSFLQFMWGTRANWSANDWRLVMVVLEDGRAVGVQELSASRFSVRRTVETGSWLGVGAQGRGIGTEMRAAVLHLAFEGLGATSASSAAREDNLASHRVSQKLGYAPNGVATVAPRDQPVHLQRYLLARQDWRSDRYPVVLTGLEACLPMFGL